MVMELMSAREMMAGPSQKGSIAWKLVVWALEAPLQVLHLPQ